MHKLSYYRRIQLSFLLFVILPILGVSIVSFLLIKQSMTEKLQLTNQNVLNVIVADIDRTIDDVIFSSNYIVNDASFRQLLKKFADTGRLRTYEDYENYTEIRDGFSLVTSKPLNNSIQMYLVNRQRLMISANPDLTQTRADLDELLRLIDPSRAEVLQWLGLVPGPSGSPGTYYMARVIRDNGQSRYDSVMLIGISASYFENLLHRVEFGKLALFDSAGARIAGDAQVALSGGAGRKSNLRSEVALERSDWTLVYEASKESYTGQISRTFYAGIAGVLLFMAVFAVSSLYIAKRLHSPIHKLQRVVRQYGLGNRDVRLDIKGRDDIAELGREINTMLDQINRLILDIEQEQEQKRVMELEALFMQIRPHFLLNTLNSIKCSLILNNDRAHSGILDSLMNLLRAYMKLNEPATLEEECRLLEHYVDIMKIRSEIPVALVVDLEPELRSLVIPKLLLQPLIENAIVHGFVDRPDAAIVVRAKREPYRVAISVEDNGTGMDDDRMEEISRLLQSGNSESYASYERVGIVNVLQRLKLTFGPEAAVSLRRNDSGGVTAELLIPSSGQADITAGGSIRYA